MVGFSGWFNKIYDRVGHVFQDRYKSEPVEGDEYLLSVVGYVLQNPVKARLCAGVADYGWSSFGELECGGGGLVDCEFLFSLVDRGGLMGYVCGKGVTAEHVDE
jgi:hypothetical protein